ncbi:MAG: hypothetical protein GX957_09310, partial [Clostridiaceae bacterium]|nr:hypothetical protein [Clostridiaceae bacterium]
MKLKIKNWIILLFILVAIYGMLLVIAELPPYGMPDNPVHNEVSERYINKALDEAGVLN